MKDQIILSPENVTKGCSNQARILPFDNYFNFVAISQVSRATVERYTGEGEPPCIVMTLRANETVSHNARFTVTLIGAQPLNTSVAISVDVDLPLSDLSPVNLYQGTDGM